MVIRSYMTCYCYNNWRINYTNLVRIFVNLKLQIFALYVGKSGWMKIMAKTVVSIVHIIIIIIHCSS